MIWKEMGLEVSVSVAPNSPQVMSEALYHIAKSFRFLPGYESQVAFSCLKGEERQWVFEKLHFKALMEKFYRENR